MYVSEEGARARVVGVETGGGEDLLEVRTVDSWSMAAGCGSISFWLSFLFGSLLSRTGTYKPYI